MKYLEVLFLITLLELAPSISQKTVGSCLITDDGENWELNTFTNSPVKDGNTLSKRFKFSGPLSIRNITGSGSVYINATIDNETSDLVFVTNHNFTNFDADHDKQGPVITIEVKFELVCDDVVEDFEFVQPVEDANNHQPLFLESVFRFQTPATLTPGTDLYDYGDYVVAGDLDFSNQNVSFEITPVGTFTVDSVPLDNSKNYLAHIVVANATTFREATVFVVYATDDAPPYLHSTAFLVITPSI